MLSDAIAIELIDLAGSERPAIIDAKEAFVFEVYASVKDMQLRLPASRKLTRASTNIRFWSPIYRSSWRPKDRRRSAMTCSGQKPCA